MSRQICKGRYGGLVMKENIAPFWSWKSNVSGVLRLCEVRGWVRGVRILDLESILRILDIVLRVLESWTFQNWLKQNARCLNYYFIKITLMLYMNRLKRNTNKYKQNFHTAFAVAQEGNEQHPEQWWQRWSPIYRSGRYLEVIIKTWWGSS